MTYTVGGKIMKKTISIILFCAMILPLVACSSDTSEKPVDTTAPSTEVVDTNVVTNYVEPMNEALKELDYDGEKISILQRTPPKSSDSTGDNYHYTNELFAE